MQHWAERCLDAVALQCHIAAMSKISNVCVYCGSSPGNNKHFMEAATDFGKILAENKINLVYGGGSFGLMGALATSVLDHGGTVSVATLAISSSTTDQTTRIFRSARSLGQI